MTTIQSHPYQLGHRVLRVLFSSPRKSHWILRIQRGPTQDDSGSHNPDRVLGLFGVVPGSTNQVELHFGICPDRGRGVRNF